VPAFDTYAKVEYVRVGDLLLGGIFADFQLRVVILLVHCQLY